MTVSKPGSDEYAEFYRTYVSLVPDDDLLGPLREEILVTRSLLSEVPSDRETWTYEPGKWTFRELTGHLVDAERVFSYRAAHIARQDPSALPGMDQLVWAAGSNAGDRPLPDLLEEWSLVRASTVSLFASLAPGALLHRGIASEEHVSVRALAAIILGHELHHRSVLRSRYGIG